MSHDSDNGFSEWGGYMDAKITKLEEQFSASSDLFRKSNLFAGISIFVNGLTNPSGDELKRIMMVHGGTFHHYERSHTTYTIASNLPDVKVRNMNTSKVIRPEWIVDCLKANRILDYSNYLLYTNQKESQPRIMFIKKKNEFESPKVKEDVSSILKDLKELNEKIKEGRLREQPKETKNANPSSNQTSAMTAVDPKFLSEFYNNSRLHHIATMGATFKQYITDLRKAHTGKFPARDKFRLEIAVDQTDFIMNDDRCVMHIDIDCFFVSVGLRKHPHLRGIPIAVTHSKGGSTEVPTNTNADRKLEMDLLSKKFESHMHNNILSNKVRSGFDGSMSLSEIASCSYEARAKGVRNGMFVGQALKLCPDLKTIPYDFEGYKEVAYKLYDIVAQYTLDIEAVSCDEMFVDLTDVLKDLHMTAMGFVEHVREEVFSETSCTCSAGIGANKLQARMATKRAKPNGQYYLANENVEEYMKNILIADLPGVGSSTEYTFKGLNLKTCGDLQSLSLIKLQLHVGKKFGETLFNFCRGIDNRPLTYGQIRKSVSAEVNYGIRFKEFTELEKFLRQLCAEVHNRLMEIQRKTKNITLKVMIRAQDAPVEASKFMGHGVCDHITKSVSLTAFTCDLNDITRNVLTLIKETNVPPHELRGIGIQLSKLDDPTESKEKNENVLKNMFNRISDRQQKANLDTITMKNDQVQKIDKISKSPTKHEIHQNKSKIAAKKRPNVLGMLQTAAKKKKISKNASFINDIDPEVLAELPADIRNEILNEYSSFASTSKDDKTINVQNLIDDHPKPDIVQPSNSNIQNNQVISLIDDNLKAVRISPENIFNQSECIQLLLAWVKSSQVPETYDINLIRDHAKELVLSKKIHDLYDPLLFLVRIINKQKSTDCFWHKAFMVIYETIQKEMCKVYEGRKLFLSEKINCSKCASKQQ